MNLLAQFVSAPLNNIQECSDTNIFRHSFSGKIQREREGKRGKEREREGKRGKERKRERKR